MPGKRKAPATDNRAPEATRKTPRPSPAVAKESPSGRSGKAAGKKPRTTKAGSAGAAKSTPPVTYAVQSAISSNTPAITIREAMREDIPALEEFVELFVQANRLLPRTTEELYDLIPFGFVAIVSGRLVGFAALEIYSAKLAEIRSLAVLGEFQGLGIGRRLVERCVDLAQHRNILEVMAITSSDGFFRACGFDFTLPGEKKALFMQTREKY